MKIYDESLNLLEYPDMEKGWLEAKTNIVHHAAVEGVKEKGHYEVIAEYHNGGKDVKWVIDVPGVEAKDARDEEEEYYIYHEYTKDELEKIAGEKNKPTIAQRIENLEQSNDDIVLMLAELIGGQK